MSQKVRVFGLKTLFLKRFTVRSTTCTLIIDKTDHALSLHSYLFHCKSQKELPVHERLEFPARTTRLFYSCVYTLVVLNLVLNLVLYT